MYQIKWHMIHENLIHLEVVTENELMNRWCNPTIDIVFVEPLE